MKIVSLNSMRNHILTIILLLLAVLAFGLRFCVAECWLNYCDIAAFLLPTIAAVVEMAVSEKSSKATEEMIKKLKDNQLSARFEGETLVFETGVDE